jgi:hypothetical protein
MCLTMRPGVVEEFTGVMSWKNDLEEKKTQKRSICYR